MALDTKQKRGSAVGIANPSRQWLVEPSGTLGATNRLSLLRYCSAITPSGAATVYPHWNIYAQQFLEAFASHV